MIYILARGKRRRLSEYDKATRSSLPAMGWEENAQSDMLALTSYRLFADRICSPKWRDARQQSNNKGQNGPLEPRSEQGVMASTNKY